MRTVKNSSMDSFASIGVMEILKYCVIFCLSAVVVVKSLNWLKPKPNSIYLVYAAEAGNIEEVKAQIQKGAYINSKDIMHDRTALICAAQYGHDDIVKMLIEAGADVNSEGRSALLQAAREGRVDVVKMLIEAGADLNSKDKDGRTALSRAAGTGHADIVKMLEDNGAT